MFHRDGPACAKARTPYDDNVARGTSELSAIRRAKVLASRESGYRVAHSRQVVRCHSMETFEQLDADSGIIWYNIRYGITRDGLGFKSIKTMTEDV